MECPQKRVGGNSPEERTRRIVLADIDQAGDVTDMPSTKIWMVLQAALP
ncbi:MAG: hypothetical protein WC382_04810 [Methanoregulaceae archaeon]